MIRTQISLTDEQAEALRRLAAERGISMAAVIREALEEMTRGTTEIDRRKRALSVVGAFGSGAKDTSTEHDRYLAGAYAE